MAAPPRVTRAANAAQTALVKRAMTFARDIRYGARALAKAPVFTLLAVAVAWTAWLWRFNPGHSRRVALVVAINLSANLIFFITHPIFTPYYIIPIDMLSLWTLLFATLNLRGQAADSNRPLTRTETVRI